VQLIIRSGSLAAARGVHNGARRPRISEMTGAEIFVLDMGEPVRIVELARAMIELSGLDPERDIEIEIVGKRPGEKLNEELFNSYESARSTDAEKILRAERSPLGVQAVESMFAEIRLLVLEGDAAALAAKVSELSSKLREVDGTSEQPAPDRGGDATPVREAPPAGGAIVASGETRHDAPAPLVHSPNS
jgi:FlaA1/EpsC-like NDP-sugar epimerase